ncbi:hypothetical protein [Photobacterium galatheae]|uniref:Uncharacterized protein n=1 Tax=Photobacterium galatheae TaxID=1654360 RepID=A0A066RRP6_9GAMM|nr:hypothetical protein [Photobacterium galatheae]KDM90357.1 hypothetical protein EA58_17845 [Photobacterium galatheae]MCM0150764.1 hypothetical protein [Photobacterium galatheae]
MNDGDNLMCIVKKLVGIIIFSVSYPTFATEYNPFETDCGNISVNEYFSNYQVYDLNMYRGSLQTEEEARDWAGKGAIVKQDMFQIRNIKISNPHYEIKCYKPFIEGEVPLPSQRLSNFYGVGIERKRIDILYVYDPKLKRETPSTQFDIVGKELWWLPNGWLYKLKTRQDNTSLCDDTEMAEFSCQLTNKKYVSLCESPEIKMLQYKYGTSGKVELVYPNQYEAPIKWQPFESTIVSFERGQYKYRIDSQHKGYVLFVTKGNKTIYSKQCKRVF